MSRWEAWRDVDSERRRIGLSLWRGGGQVEIGRRLYRWRSTRNDGPRVSS